MPSKEQTKQRDTLIEYAEAYKALGMLNDVTEDSDVWDKERLAVLVGDLRLLLTSLEETLKKA